MGNRTGKPDTGNGTASMEPLVSERFDWSATPPSMAIVDVLSDLEGANPLDCAAGEGRLHDHVDPDALDALVTHRPGGIPTVVVTIGGYLVRIEDDRLSISPSEQQPSRSGS